jgi:hypothetical protein
MQKSRIKSRDDNIIDQLTGTPAVRPEYYVRERRVVRAEITVERVVNLVGLGATNLIGSGAMVTNILGV